MSIKERIFSHLKRVIQNRFTKSNEEGQSLNNRWKIFGFRYE